MTCRITIHRCIVVGLCTTLFLQLLPIEVEALHSTNKSQITVNIGKPTIWSLAQAHYLLANMRQNNRFSLDVPLSANALDPNAPNAARMDILRTFLGAEAQFSGVAGAQNRAVLQKFRDENNRRQKVQTRLDLVTQQYLDAVRERSDLMRKLSKVKDTDANAEQRRKDLQAAIDQKKDEQDALNAEMTALNSQLTEAPTLGELNSTAPFGATSLAGKEGDLDAIVAAIEKTSPKLSASTALDNYIQMQYEVIAKQLTLLRDEVGPGERLIFLELPSDVYSVPKVDDDYVVQVEWKVKRYFGRGPGTEEREDRGGSGKQSDPITLQRIKQYASLTPTLTQENSRRQHSDMSGMEWIEPSAGQSEFRVVDVIPRQSALNVNDVQAQTRGFALAAKFLTVFGLGGQVSYERQRTLYGQFMQQEVYASGYGKGLDRFGWTFGPTPGTKRLAPGVRTTYAIMSIPEAAVAIELEPTARIYPRDASPESTATRLETRDAPFQVLIPNEHTEGFWVDSIYYTPVKKGERVTAILGGRYFSPLTGVLIDGVPLKRAVSIAKNESDTTNLTAAIDAFGEYEYLNPGKIILSFKMPDPEYVGTPLITLVTPERTSAINYFDLTINRDRDKSLAEMSEKEPMFLGGFSLTKVEVVATKPNSSDIDIRLTGTGFRTNANLFVDEAIVPLESNKVKRISTTTCHATITPKDSRSWKITYRLGAEEATLSYKSGAPSIESIENPSTGKPEGSVDGGTIVTIRGKNLGEIRHVLFGEREAEVKRRDNEVLFVRVPENQEGAVHVVVTGNKQNESEPTNISDFSTAGKAIYTYTPSTRIKIPFAPSIDTIENPTTGKPEGPVDEDVSVVISGVNLEDIEHVFFGPREGDILKRGSHVLFVRVPRGNVGGVPVLVQTSERPDKTRLTNIDDFKTPGRAIYKYIAGEKPRSPRNGEVAVSARATEVVGPAPPASSLATLRKPRRKRCR